MQELTIITGGGGGTARAIALKLPNCIAPDRSMLDVTDPNVVRMFMYKFKPKILINCAGYIYPSNVLDSDVSEWQKEVNVNLMGAYYCTKYALMNGATKIINIASAAGFKGRGGWSWYSASKAGMISLTESLVEEGVDAYCISPHRIDTKMRNSLFPDEDRNSLLNPERVADEIVKIVNGEYPRGTHLDIALSGVTLIQK